MSRIGKLPISIPEGVSLTADGLSVMVKGPKGQMDLKMPRAITIEQKDRQIFVVNKRKNRDSSAIYGLFRSLLANTVIGVSREWSKVLELTGVGYRANMQGVNLVLNLGFSHDVTIEPPTGIKFEVKDGKIIVLGIDKQKVGQIAADIRSVRPPEPYKGKGIHYQGEKIRRKAGKAAKAVGGAK